MRRFYRAAGSLGEKHERLALTADMPMLVTAMSNRNIDAALSSMAGGEADMGDDYFVDKQRRGPRRSMPAEIDASDWH